MYSYSLHTTSWLLCCILAGFTQHIFDPQVKDQVQEMTKKTYEVFIAIKFIEQIVNGANYIIKVIFSVTFTMSLLNFGRKCDTL